MKAEHYKASRLEEIGSQRERRLRDLIHTLMSFEKVRALVTYLCPTFATQWIVAHQAPLSMEFSRQEDWSGLPFPTIGDLLDSGIKPHVLHLLHQQVDSLPLCHLGIPISLICAILKNNTNEYMYKIETE